MSQCNVVDSNLCLAPANSDAHIRTECYACGLPACTSCSLLTYWYGQKRRVCFNCLRDNRRTAEIDAFYDSVGGLR